MKNVEKISGREKRRKMNLQRRKFDEWKDNDE